MKALPNCYFCHSYTSERFKIILTTTFVFILFANCSFDKSSEYLEPEVVELTNFETIISFEDEILATPVILKKAADSTLFVFDEALGKVIHLKENGEIIREYGRKGRGPGEYGGVNNFFLSEDYIFVIDPGKDVIHKFRIYGDLAATFTYGEIQSHATAPPPPPMGMAVKAKDLNNQPVVTLEGKIFLSNLNYSDSALSIFRLSDWEGNEIAQIGDIPKGSTAILDYEKMKEDVSNRVVPSYYRTNAFPVQDKKRPDEYFMIYSSLPHLIKYNSTGKKLWEKEIPSTTEIDSLTTGFFNIMERLQKSDIRNRIPLQYYVAGVSSPDGDLFLAMDRNPLWIHQFNPSGEITRRYKLVSDDAAIEPIFDIDFDSNRILIATEDGDIRGYSF